MDSLAGMHPLIDKKLSTSKEIIFQKLIGQKESYLFDHRLMGQPCFLASAYLEMIRAAISFYQLSEPKQILQLKDVTFYKTFWSIDEEPLLEISLEPKLEPHYFKISSSTKTQALSLDVSGSIAYSHEMYRVMKPDFYKEKPDWQTYGQEELYAELRRLGFDYPPGTQVLQSYHKDNNEMMAWVKLPYFFTYADPAFYAHPLAFDALFQALALFMNKSKSPCLPVSIGEINFYSPLPPVFDVYVLGLETQPPAFNCLCLGPRGEILLDLHHVVMQKVHELNDGSRFVCSESKSEGTCRDTVRSNGLKPQEPMAIIGIQGVFPGCKNLLEFWQKLVDKSSLISSLPLSRKSLSLLNSLEMKSFGAWLEDIYQFDANFFNFEDEKARLMDPQQRLLLQVVWSLLESAAYTLGQLTQAKAGLFIANTNHDYEEILSRQEKLGGITDVSGSALANRLSEFFNFTGPSEVIDTGYSSSLSAIHQAIKSIEQGDCEVAIVAAVNTLLSPNPFFRLDKEGFLSPTGSCKSFDREADGFVRGEGAGAILLKPLAKALEDKDLIYALIKGSAINHRGHHEHSTQSGSFSQAEVILKACERAGLDLERLSYIEADGRAHPVDDLCEIQGLKEAFSGKKQDEKICALGSIKPNFGHLEAASGMVGLFKVVLALQHKRLPGLASFQESNPKLNITSFPFYLLEETQSWEAQQDRVGNFLPRVAGISSFGLTGSNAHVIVEEAGKTQEVEKPLKPAYLMTLSAKTKEALMQRLRDLATWLEVNAQSLNKSWILESISYTLSARREHFNMRCAFVVKSLDELQNTVLGLLEKRTFKHAFFNSKIDDTLKHGSLFRQVFRILIKELTESSNHSNAAYYDKLLALADFYTEGYDLDWELLYEDSSVEKLSLPTYPFANTAYYFEDLESKNPPEHPQETWEKTVTQEANTQASAEVLASSTHELLQPSMEVPIAELSPEEFLPQEVTKELKPEEANESLENQSVELEKKAMNLDLTGPNLPLEPLLKPGPEVSEAEGELRLAPHGEFFEFSSPPEVQESNYTEEENLPPLQEVKTISSPTRDPIFHDFLTATSELSESMKSTPHPESSRDLHEGGIKPEETIADDSQGLKSTLVTPENLPGHIKSMSEEELLASLLPLLKKTEDHKQ